MGDPYKIDGHEYRPADTPLDEVGYAGVIAGADGAAEGAISAVHRTLPLPSFAEVTALATGRTILVRVTDRGPMANDRVIDLSCGAVRQLGLGALPAAVRVRRVNPPDQERTVLNNGHRAAERMASPEGLLSALRRKLPPPSSPVNADGCALTPATVTPLSVPDVPAVRPQPPASPAAKPVPVEAKHSPDLVPPSPSQQPSLPPRPASPLAAPAPEPKGPGYDIQVAALSNRAKAVSLARRIGGRVEAAGPIFRVRKGPYPTEVAARAALPQIRAKGFADARVVTNGGR
ncbi:hypothetical protein BH10PSE13_BH10PSE13_24010 [soil metagenome]